jgi:hypothetical protein
MARPAATAEAPKAVRAAMWVGKKPVVVCADGPLAGRWYFEEWWHAQVAACEHLLTKGQPRGVWLGYALTDATREHPTQPTSGRVLRWNGRKESRR